MDRSSRCYDRVSFKTNCLKYHMLLWGKSPAIYWQTTCQRQTGSLTTWHAANWCSFHFRCLALGIFTVEKKKNNRKWIIITEIIGLIMIYIWPTNVLSVLQRRPIKSSWLSAVSPYSPTAALTVHGEVNEYRIELEYIEKEKDLGVSRDLTLSQVHRVQTKCAAKARRIVRMIRRNFRNLAS